MPRLFQHAAFTDSVQALLRDRYGYPVERGVVAAITSLLLRTATANRFVDENEAQVILDLLVQHLQIPLPDALRLIKVAEHLESTEASTPIRVLREHYDLRQRKTLIAFLWCVVLADGKIESSERELVTRLGVELSLSPGEIREARKTAIHHIRALFAPLPTLKVLTTTAPERETT